MRFEDADRVEETPESGSSVPESAADGVAPEADVPAEAADGNAGTAAELASQKEKYLRLAAEYDNYRKRTDRERLEYRDRAQGQLVERLLDAIDDLQRVSALEPASTTIESLIEGIRMVERKLFRALEAEGLEAIEARGQAFDPSVHEAIVMAPTSEASQDHTVGEVFQTGYRFRGGLLRPARVQVMKHEG